MDMLKCLLCIQSPDNLAYRILLHIFNTLMSLWWPSHRKRGFSLLLRLDLWPQRLPRLFKLSLTLSCHQHLSIIFLFFRLLLILACNLSWGLSRLFDSRRLLFGAPRSASLQQACLSSVLRFFISLQEAYVALAKLRDRFSVRLSLFSLSFFLLSHLRT